MEQRKIVLLAATTAMIPFVFVLWSHSSRLPEMFTEYTDVYRPQGPTQTFSDFSPSDRTGVLTTVNNVSARPVIAGPVYLLFQPRRHSKYIDVEITIEPMEITKKDMPRIGYRHGTGPEGNVFVKTDYVSARDGLKLYALIPFAEMTRERIDARRIVFEAPTASTSTPVYITKVKIYYEEN